jgi:hypothetical protein
MENNYKACKNCEEKFQEEFEFCPYCGQKAKEDLTIGVLFYNTISNYFSFDARFFKSFLPLMFRPGYLTRKFIEGKRLLYLHPAQYYLFVSVLFFFLFSFQAREYTQQLDGVLKKSFKSESISSLDSISKKTIDSNTIAKITEPFKDPRITTGLDKVELKTLDSILTESVNSENTSGFNLGSVTKKLDSLIAIDAPEEEQLKALGMSEDAKFLNRRFYTRMLKFYKNSGGGILQAFFDSIPIALFILLPIFALILKAFFWKRGSFAHHLVFSFYYFSFLFVVLSIILSLSYIWNVPAWIYGTLVLSIYFYLLVAIKKFYRQGYFLSFIKTGMVVFIYLLIVLPIAFGIMAATSFFFY